MKKYICMLVLLASAFPVMGDGAETVDVSALPKGVERVEIFLLMGQSNMMGRGTLPKKQSEHPRILNRNMANDLWVTAKHPLHKAGVPDLIDGSDRAGVGPGLDFAQVMVNKKKDVTIALIPVAQGGSWIDLWKGGSTNYEKTIRKANKAMADFPEGTARIAGVLWLQGESDSLENRYGVYSEKLTDLVVRLRTDLNDPELPFVACTIRPDIIPKGKYLHVKEINDDLLNLPKQVPNTACVDARDLDDGHIGDYMHYNTEAQQIIGRRFAVEYFRMVN